MAPSRSRRPARGLLPLLLGAAAALLAACEGPPQVDRTRPDYVRKADLTSGTWYVMDTVVGVPSTSSLTFEGMQGQLEKVRLEVQEGHLVAFRAYEYLPGSDPRVDPDASAPGGTVGRDGTRFRGAPVYAWPITSHFDRQRQYNPATGEQSNVLEENTTDRPWHQREFMRVDWGRNVVKNHFSLSGGGLGGASEPGAAYSPAVTPLELDEGDDAFTTEVRLKEGGGEELVYLDFTARQHWEPQKVDYPPYGRIPYCLFDPTEDCASAEVRVRTSLRRVDEARARDYEPLRYDDRLMVKFGFFRTERFTYDPDRGVTQSGRILLANRHNLWQRSRDAQGRPIPVAQREVRPLVYHLSPGFPRELLPAVRALEASWDHAFRRAVAVPRGTTPEQVGQAFFVCETPVPAGAPAACGPLGTTPRLGDLRYNLLAWVDRPQKAGPLGYGPTGADPETGEVVQGAAYVYGAALDVWAGEAQLVVDVLNGLTSVDALVAGKPVRDYVNLTLAEGDPRLQEGPAPSRQGLVDSGGAAPLSPLAALKGRARATLDAWRAGGGPPRPSGDRRRVAEALIQQSPALESSLVDLPEVRAAVMSLAPGEAWRRKLEADPAFLRSVARQTMLRMDEVRALRQRRDAFASRNNIWLAEFSDDAFRALALEKRAVYEQRLGDYLARGESQEKARALAQADVYLELRLAAFRSVAEHEVGHTVGLRHNFQGSFDALNYREGWTDRAGRAQPGYWALRKQTIGVRAGGQRVLPLTPADLAAAAEPTTGQVNGRLHELAYASVMDYSARLNGTIHGLGRYDEAAVLFGYAGGAEPGWVEVFERTAQGFEAPLRTLPTTDAARPMTVRSAHLELPFLQATRSNSYGAFYGDRTHYTLMPFQFAEPGLPLEQALEQGVERMGRRTHRPWSEMSALYGRIEALAKRLAVEDVGGLIRDYNNVQMAPAVLQILGQLPEDQGWRGPIPVEVPYLYCSDGEVGANVTCNRFDTGADLYEVTRDWVRRYEDHYAFSHFRRERLQFGVDQVFARTYGGLLGNLPNVYQNWLFNLYLYQAQLGLSPEDADLGYGLGDPTFQAYYTMGVFDGLNALLRTFSAVPPGYYGRVAGEERWERLAENAADASRLADAPEAALVSRVTAAGGRYDDVAYLPRGAGVRSPHTRTATDGYDFWSRVQEVGHFWDQYAALNALTSSTTNFLGVDRGSDALRYSLPYYIVFPDELSRAFSSVWLEEPGATAPALVRTGGRLARVEAPVQVRASDFLAGFDYPPAPASPPATAGRVEARPVWGTRYYTQLFGMAFFTENFDQDFASRNQVFALGSGDNVQPAAGFGVVSLPDPAGGGFSFAALCRLEAGGGPACAEPLTPAATMVLRGRALARQLEDPATPEASRAALQAQLRETARSLEIMRGLYGVFGRTL